MCTCILRVHGGQSTAEHRGARSLTNEMIEVHRYYDEDKVTEYFAHAVSDLMHSTLDYGMTIIGT